MNNSQNDSKKTVMQVLADETGGKSYKAHKYGLDHAERPFIDYSEDTIIWEKTAETDRTINIPRLCRNVIKLRKRCKRQKLLHLFYVYNVNFCK